MYRLIIVLLVLVPFGTAHAAPLVLTTPPVLGDRVTCLIANAGSASLTVNVDLIAGSNSSTPVTTNLATSSVLVGHGIIALGAGDDEIAYCRFTITDGPKANARASACSVLLSLGEKCATSADAR